MKAGAVKARAVKAGAVKARVTVMLKEGVLDPQGRAIGHALTNLGFAGVGEVRAGKVIEVVLEDMDAGEAQAKAEAMARKLLANPVIEDFTVEVT
jgi:phosphoribosylformylglycinamidine synthase